MNSTAQKYVELYAKKIGHVIALADFDAISEISRVADAWENPATSAEGELLHWLPVELGKIIFYRPSVAAIAYVQSVEEDVGGALYSDALLAHIMTRRDQLTYIRDKLKTPRKARKHARRFARTCSLTPAQLSALIFSLMGVDAGSVEPDVDPADDKSVAPAVVFEPLPADLVAALCAENNLTPDELIDHEPAHVNNLVTRLIARGDPEGKVLADHNRGHFFALLEKLVKSWVAEKDDAGVPPTEGDPHV